MTSIVSRLKRCFVERRCDDVNEVFLDTRTSLHGDFILKGVIGGVETSLDG